MSTHPYMLEVQRAVLETDFLAPLSHVNLALHENIQNMSTTLSEFTRNAVQYYVQTVQQIREVAISQLQEILIRPEVRYALTFAQNTTAQVRINSKNFKSYRIDIGSIEV